MRYLLLAVCIGLACAQSTIDPSVLEGIFGTPPTTKPVGPVTPALEDHRRGTTRGKAPLTSTPVDTSLLIEVFGTPPSNTAREGFESITVKPTEGTSVFTDKNGEACQCVPYYLCDANQVGVDVNNASVTGWGTLDIRFGEDNDIDRQCQESVEVCCTIPKDTSEQPKPKPKPKPEPNQAKGCGYRNPNGVGGITVTGGGGAESQFGEFPWVVAILDRYNSSYGGVGVLIHPQVVMTGAHIAQRYAPGGIKIRAGEWDTQTIKEIFPYEERNVQNVVVHENFMPKSLKNDIALLYLDSPLPISEYINVICMPEQDEVFDSHKNCVANGWGKSHFGLQNRYAVILKKVELDMVPYSRCQSLLRRTRLGHNFKLHNSFVCAGGEAGKDTCQGDGGAPLACQFGNSRYKLTGLVAWGIGCGQQDVPAVYTNVPLFRKWIDEKLRLWGVAATSYSHIKVLTIN
ncbi:phenoloxidase-activating factor 2-like isoform X1 [Spodoptera frugiperda]|uniref:Phenoloxidase-activating factor 2 n=1 Tax=Spodoptera frugiperda TaxID=7108 RepID=A0A9R0E6V9_SPOFR|nr:phenoloxidase-activating factor 2-like isoform X1 [Spodoptera frugiperda]